MKGLNRGHLDYVSMNLLGVMLGRAENEDDAKSICSLFDDCPYSVMNVLKETMLVLLFSIPEDHKWWLEGVENEPKETLGLSEVEVFFSEHFDDLSRKIVSREEPPCGTDCNKCKCYMEKCRGCPSVYDNREQLYE